MTCPSDKFDVRRCSMAASFELTELEASSATHGEPTDGMECMATMEDITTEDKNYCEYQTMPSGRWHPSLYSTDVLLRLIKTQFPDYMSGVRKADCEADLKRRLDKGPPVWVEDKHALPCPEEDTHIERIWLADTGKEYSAKLKDCVEVCALFLLPAFCLRLRMQTIAHPCCVCARRRARSAINCGRS